MDEEKLVKEIWKKGKHRVSPCPDEEIIASFTENLLSPKKIEEVMGHIALCKLCREKVILLNRVKEFEGTEPVLNPPERVVQKAIDLMQKPAIIPNYDLRTTIYERRKIENRKSKIVNSKVDIVLRIAKKAIEVLKNPANLDITLIPVPVMRGKPSPILGRGKKTSRQNYINIRKKFENLVLNVEVEKTLIGKTELRANISPLDKERSVEGIRISLISKAGLESYMTEGREVVFKDVLPGLSTIEITQGDRKIGEMSLELEDSNG